MHDDPRPDPSVRSAAHEARDAARLGALSRAARALTESLELETVLERISREAVAILDADVAGVYRGSAEEGLTLVTAHGLPPEAIGLHLEAGMGLGGRVVRTGEPAHTDHYQETIPLPPHVPYGRVQAGVAVPMSWGGEPRGVLSVGYLRPRRIDAGDIALLEAFAALASAAYTTAGTHAGLAQVARTDALTGCLNHAALHESLRREIERTRRGLAAPPSVILVDLDDFAQLNERHGHLLGDEVLRRVGRALRTATRVYDLAARYGGDDFALVCVEATESEAVEVARRALERTATAIGDLRAGNTGHATAGVAVWEADLPPAELLNRAGRALTHGKQHGGRGDAHAYSELPDWFRPGRFGRTRGAPGGAPVPPAPAPGWPPSAGEATDRLRTRARSLASAAELGARLAVMLDDRAVGAEVTRALCDGFGWRGAMIRACDEDEPLAISGMWGEEGAGAEDATIAIPVPGGAAPWGSLAVRSAGNPSEDDVRLLETVALHAGAALEAARRHREALGGS